jgi:hypothetical protein
VVKPVTILEIDVGRHATLDERPAQRGKGGATMTARELDQFVAGNGSVTPLRTFSLEAQRTPSHHPDIQCLERVDNLVPLWLDAVLVCP